MTLTLPNNRSFDAVLTDSLVQQTAKAWYNGGGTTHNFYNFAMLVLEVLANIETEQQFRQQVKESN